MSGASNASPERPAWIAIGSGSATVAVTNVKLQNEMGARRQSTVDISTVQEINYTSDWDSVTMSGLVLREFGLFTTGAVSAGSNWARDQLTGSLVFDGTQELQIEYKIETF